MTTKNKIISISDITKEVKRLNSFVGSKLKAYDLMSKSWYYYDIDEVFWNNIEKCVKENLSNYELWLFCISIEIQNKKLNIYKGCAKRYINKVNNSSLFKGFEIAKIKNDSIIHFYCALKLSENNKFKNEYDICPSLKKYYLLLPKDIEDSTIVDFIQHKWNNSLKSKKAIEIEKELYSFLVKNKGILIEEYNDSKYYEYKGEASGFILIDPLSLCPIEKQYKSINMGYGD